MNACMNEEDLRQVEGDFHRPRFGLGSIHLHCVLALLNAVQHVAELDIRTRLELDLVQVAADTRESSPSA